MTTAPLIILKPRKEESVLRFHPWVFSGAISRIVLSKSYPYDAPQEGEIVQVANADGKVLAVGHWQIGSIAVRILAFGVETLPAIFNFFRRRRFFTGFSSGRISRHGCYAGALDRHAYSAHGDSQSHH